MSATKVIVTSALAATLPVGASGETQQRLIVIEDSILQEMVFDGVVIRDLATGQLTLDPEALQADLSLDDYLEGLREIGGIEIEISQESIEEMQLSTQEGIPEK